MNENYNEIPSLSDDPEEEEDELKSVDMVPSEDQLLTETDDTDTTDDEEEDADDAPQDETHENDTDDTVPLDEQEEEENTIVDPTTAKQHYIIRHADKQATTTSPGMLNLHLNLNLNKEGEQSMSQRKAALTVQEVNQQNNVKDTGYNFQSAQDRPATLDQYDLTNDPHRDFDNMQGQTSIYSMKPTATTAMRLAARMLKHGLRDGDVNDPTAVADVADEIRDTMSEGEARDKADILKEMDDKNDDEIREIEHEIHDDKDHMKMDDHDIHDDEKHLDRLETASRHAHHYRKAASLPENLNDLMNLYDYWEGDHNTSERMGIFIHNLGLLQKRDYHLFPDSIGSTRLLERGIDDFLQWVDDSTLTDLESVQNDMRDYLQNNMMTASRYSRRFHHHAMKRHTSSYRKADARAVHTLDDMSGTWVNFTNHSDKFGEFLKYISLLHVEDYMYLEPEVISQLLAFITAFLDQIDPYTIISNLDRVSQEMHDYESRASENTTASRHAHHSRRHAMKRHTSSYRKADYSGADADLVPPTFPYYLEDTLKSFHLYSDGWALLLNYLASIPDLPEYDRQMIDRPGYLAWLIDNFTDALDSNIINRLQETANLLHNEYERDDEDEDEDEDEDDEFTPFFASRHSHHSRRHAMKRHTSSYRKADAQALEDLFDDKATWDDFLNHSAAWGDFLNILAFLDPSDLSNLSKSDVEDLKNALDKFLDCLEPYNDGLDAALYDSLHRMENTLSNTTASRHSHHSRRHAETDEHTVCDVRMTKDGDYEARCDGKVKRFDKKGDALEWLSDHFNDSYHDKPEFTDKDKKAARLQKLIAAHRKQIMSSKAPRQIERTPSVRMASSMSPAAKTDISSILL